MKYLMFILPLLIGQDRPATDTVIEYNRGKVTPIMSRAVSGRPSQRSGDILLNEQQMFEVTRAEMAKQLAFERYQNAEMRHELLITKLREELGVPAGWLFHLDTNRFSPPPEPRPTIQGGRP